MANITRWEPFQDFMSLRDAMNRLFEDSMVRARGIGGETPAMDVYETDDDVVVKTALPGVKAEDIDITVTGDTLTIKGQFKEEEDVKEENYIRRERRQGSFMRSIALPTFVDADNAEANFEDGILKLTLPKKPEAKAKSIQVKGKTTQ